MGRADRFFRIWAREVIQFDGSQWNVVQSLQASGGANGDRFGASVAIDGDIAVIGAPMDDHAGPTNAGAAYVFRRVNGAWLQEARLTALDAQANDNFGTSVAIDDELIVVGAPLDDDNGFNSGSA